LELHFDRQGGVRATLRLTFSPPAPEIWQHALRMTLHAPLDHVREETTRRGWLLHAHAAAVLERSVWTVEGAIDLNPLLGLLRLFNVAELWLSIEHPSASFSDCSAGEPRWDFVNTHYSTAVPVAAPPPVHLAFGYPPERTWRFVPGVVLLLAPIGLCLWLPRLGIKKGSDRFGVWFGCWRRHGWLTRAVWFFWLLTAFAGGFGLLAGFLVCGIFGSGEYVWLALVLLLPPALVMLICKVLSAPAFADVPEVGWTRGRLFKQALWGQFGVVVVGLCLAHAVDAELADPSSWSGLPSFVAAVGLLAVCIGGWVVLHNTALEILPPGELRQRLFELAEQIQVRVQQAYLATAAQWKLLNALGALGNCVHITPEVLPHLSRREVDALLAVELARLARRHRGALWWAIGFFLPVLVFGTCLGLLVALAGWETSWPLLLLAFLLSLALRLRRRGQHFVPSLDRDALSITGDPEALLTALAKLRRQSLLPLVIGKERQVFDGPLEDWPRLQDLADRARIPPERLREILDRPGSGEDHYPPQPTATGATRESDARLFSTEFRRRTAARQNALRLALEMAPPAMAAYVVQSQNWQGAWLAGAYVAGLLLMVMIRRLAEHCMGVQTSRGLRRGIRGRLVSEGLQPDAWGGIFVGLSPHAEPRSYENFLIWDMGFLVLAGDRCCYLGDRTRFALKREHIQDVYLGRGASSGPGARIAQRVYVRWWDEERGVGGTFNLAVSQPHSLWQRGPRPADLEKRLRDWLRQPAASDEVPPPLRALSSPDFGAVASESLVKLAAVNILFALLVLRAPFAIGICFLLGLSFDREAGAGAWYVLLSVALMQVWTVLSFQRYRGKRDDSGDADALAPGSD
jgi:hypothetical protein